MDLIKETKAVIRKHQLDNWLKAYPWLTGQLGKPTAKIWFIGENPSLSQVQKIDGRATEKTENLQWNASKADALFREAITEAGLKRGEAGKNKGWNCYITNSVKEPEIVKERNEKKGGRQYRKEQAERWLPVLQKQIDHGRPKVLVLLGGRVEEIIGDMKKLGLNHPPLEKIPHYSWIMSYPERKTGRGAGHPGRIKEYKNLFKAIAARYSS